MVGIRLTEYSQVVTPVVFYYFCGHYHDFYQCLLTKGEVENTPSIWVGNPLDPVFPPPQLNNSPQPPQVLEMMTSADTHFQLLPFIDNHYLKSFL